ncbi:helix-turn-helix domain-containing protein [Streptomyces sp. NPDC056708]|uniref:helix-turn-helix domain-containing protein n=1 Tax=unclassified Streptomyces TaxID=2593676 RepID=UPI00368199BC
MIQEHRRTYRPRLKGDARRALAHDLAESYEAGASIRELAASRDRAYGTVRKLLGEANVTIRPRGNTRTPNPN